MTSALPHTAAEFVVWCTSRGGRVWLDEAHVVHALVNWRDYEIGDMTAERFGATLSRLAEDLRTLLEAEDVDDTVH